MAQLMITLQYRENYGFPEGKSYWKNKGGDSVVVPNLKVVPTTTKEINDMLGEEYVWSNDASSQEVVDWEVVGDDWEIELPDYMIHEYNDPREIESWIRTFAPKLVCLN